jgi:hypothetical protein
MVSPSVVLAIYESSLLSQSGVPLTDGWQGIADSYTEPAVRSLFNDLRNDFLSHTPSFQPFERSESLKDNLIVVRHFTELAANTTLFDRGWHDLAVALVLKQKLQTTVPTEADIRLAFYLLSFGDHFSGESLSEVMQSWSSEPQWQLKNKTSYPSDFPAEWWNTFTTDSQAVEFPKTITLILKNCLLSGSLEETIPKVSLAWTRFKQIVGQVFV